MSHSCEYALERLKSGNAAHVARNSDRSSSPHAEIGTDPCPGGQQPYAAIVSCADSRVIPEDIFNAGPNEIFVIRVAGNVADTSVIASLEYAVAALQIPLIVVIGHQCCGAVGAALGNATGGLKTYTPALDNLLALITPSVSPEVPGFPKAPYGYSQDPVEAIKKNALNTKAFLPANSTVIDDAVNEGKLLMTAAYYELSGNVVWLEDYQCPPTA